jgi:predicted metal-dependent hydrolase
MFPDVQLRFSWDVFDRSSRTREIVIAGETLPVLVVRHRRARRYVVRVNGEGVRLTVPRGASIAGGMAFAERQAPWVEREWRRQRERQAPWTAGTTLWFRGTQAALAIADGHALLGSTRVDTPIADRNLRTTVEPWLRAQAERELPARCHELAASCGVAVSRVAVRNQRSRWGACSPRRVITLNWRLIQMPPEVSDYIIFHELMHLKQPNHSRRFWREVDKVCTWWRSAERWLRVHGREIL